MKKFEIKLITDYKKGEMFKPLEEKLKERFGKNHGVNCDEVLEFVKVYSDNRGTGFFKTPAGEILTLKATDVEKIICKNLKTNTTPAT